MNRERQQNHRTEQNQSGPFDRPIDELKAGLRASESTKKGLPRASLSPFDRLRSGESRGAALVEYALIVALIALAAIPAVSGLQGEVWWVFNNVTDTLAQASVD